MTLVVFTLTVRPADSEDQDLDVLKVIPENYKLVLVEWPWVAALYFGSGKGNCAPSGNG